MYSSIKIKDYKCFVKENDYQGFDVIKPINVIIGKNNSGKSKLLEALAGIVEGTEKSMTFEGRLVRPIEEYEIMMFCKYNNDPLYFTSHCHSNETTWDVIGRYLVGQSASFILKNKNITPEKFFLQNRSQNWSSHNISDTLKSYLTFNPFKDYRFLHLRAERDINKEAIKFDTQITSHRIGANATGICSLIARMLNDANGHIEKLIGISGNEVNWKQYIENDFLQLLNEVVMPEITFSRIYTLTNENHLHEIYLEEKNKGGIKLSDCGSGLKTIIATLTLLHTIPRLSGNYKNVFAFEELENNLHPNLERKLLSHIKKYSQRYNEALIFLTTHSNVAIDLFGNDYNSQIVKVCNDGCKSTVEAVISSDDKRKLLDDLGIKASDILQSNCVIWVEGPSDRIYIKKWLQEFGSKDFDEGLNYQFIYYGGALLSHYTADENKQTENLIDLLKTNKNSFVVMDSDKKTSKDELKSRVSRIMKELPSAHWVTAGKEIENYLPNEVLTDYFDKDINVNDFTSFSDIYKENKGVETFDKVKFASEIIKNKNYNKTNLSKCLDLEEQINNLIDFIKKSNLDNC